MKLTRQQLRKLIKEMAAPPMEYMFHMIDIGDSMVKQLYKYIMKYQNYIDILIYETPKSAPNRIEITMLFSGLPIGKISANKWSYKSGETPCNNAWSVGVSEIKGAGWLEGHDQEYLDQKLDYSNVPKIFRDESGYGPIIYEILLEHISIKHKEHLTQDRENVSSSAYNTWEFYFKNRPDVEQHQIDVDGDCPIEASTEYYEMDPEGNPDALEAYDANYDLTQHYKDYALKHDPLMKSYSKKDNPFTRALMQMNMIKYL